MVWLCILMPTVSEDVDVDVDADVDVAGFRGERSC